MPEALYYRLVRTTVWADFVFLPAASRTGSSGCVSTVCAGRSSPSVRNACPTSASARHMPFPDMIPRIAGNGTPHSFGKESHRPLSPLGKGTPLPGGPVAEEFGLSRHDLARAVEDRRSHPFGRFIYPEYEETTKRRLLSTEAGYLVCALSTLMWTPFSPSCSKNVRKRSHAAEGHRRAIRNCTVSAVRRGGKREGEAMSAVNPLSAEFLYELYATALRQEPLCAVPSPAYA